MFFFGRDGHIFRAVILEASGDGSALASAQAFNHLGAAEVWQGARLVGRFEPGELSARALED